MLAGRWDPPLPLHRYRLAGRLSRCAARTWPSPATRPPNCSPCTASTLGPAGLSSLLEHTEGWAAGLRLFAMALQDRRDADSLVDTITGNEATIAEYFVDEVLRVQPPHVRSFLLEASILDTFTPELAEAVTGRADARRLLTDLERHNAFVQPASEYSASYRFHRLFAELLRAQLMCESIRSAPLQLHRRAAAWFAAQGQTTDAVSHAVKAAGLGRRRHDRRRALHDRPAACSGGRGGGLGRAAANTCPTTSTTPSTAIVAAALALADGSIDRCAHQLSRAQELVMRRDWQYSPALALADLVLGVLLAAARRRPRSGRADDAGDRVRPGPGAARAAGPASRAARPDAGRQGRRAELARRRRRGRRDAHRGRHASRRRAASTPGSTACSTSR